MRRGCLARRVMLSRNCCHDGGVKSSSIPRRAMEGQWPVRTLPTQCALCVGRAAVATGLTQSTVGCSGWPAPLWLPSGGRLMSGLGSGVVRPGIDSPAWLVQPLWRPEARDGTAGPAGKRRSHCDCLFGPSPPPPAPLERTLEGCCPVLVAADFTPSKLLQHEALTD